MRDFGDNIAYQLTAGEGDIDAALAALGSSPQTTHCPSAARADCDGRSRRAGAILSRRRRADCLVVNADSHLLRTQLALMIGIPENKLRVITPEVGGGFGSKLNVYAEEALLGWISMQLGKPVKWIEGRRENIQSHDPWPRAGWLHRDWLQDTTAPLPGSAMTCSPTWALITNCSRRPFRR